MTRDRRAEADRPGTRGQLGRREFLIGLAGGAAAVLSRGPTGPGRAGAATLAAVGPVAAFGADVAMAWLDQALVLVRTTPGFSPPVASRALGYAGVTLYESVVPGMPEHRSLAGLLNGLTPPPPPADPAYHWPTVANSTLAAILRQLFPTAPAAGRAAIDALEESLAHAFRAALPRGRYRRSVERGRAVADHVFDWSRSDGGHEAYLDNFPPYTPPSGPGLWVPTPPGFLRALQPYWGENRPFVLASGGECAPEPPTAFSVDPGSPFYAEAREVYDAVNGLTPEQRAIALFWSDDPGATVTPPGHSVSMLTQALAATGAGLDVAAEAYTKVGMAVADAFVACWDTKYRHNLLRPVTCIRDVIDPQWSSLLVTPPFPEYTSGHSVQSGAAAEVLTDLFGELPFTDHTHDHRGLAPRSFGSFWQAAEEAALSRLYGGIHFIPAIARGLEQGRCIGQAVNALTMRRSA